MAVCLVDPEIQAAGVVTIRSVSKTNDTERVQTAVKLQELKTILEVYYSYLETDDGQKENNPSHCLNKQYNNSKLTPTHRVVHLAGEGRTEQKGRKHRWINV